MNKQALQQLVSGIRRHATLDASVGTPIHELHLSCFAAPTELTSLVYEPCLCIIAQGSKEVLLAEQSFRLDPAQFLLVSVDLPVDARVQSATPSKPYLGLRISLDPKVVGELLADGANVSSTAGSERGLAVTPTDPQLLDAVLRLVNLLDAPADIKPLAPLVLREITHRVLTGPQGLRLRQIALAGAPAYRIASAIRWLKDHFADPLKIESLAAQVGLSTSSFHQHFKNVTAMTPLQYQKRMRLQEARSLMIGEKLDAAEAGFRVGYESPSQFSREYRRMFGAPPRQDVEAVLSSATS
ncbi:AraC family transcriptional regulator [Roseiconus nitratireducens]|uniref:AraC family transcriptional regulator n=1 Tax=Roseiconus nitratireducens TaxID=2605748 RepID=A0A5M6DGR8_9BACT|nr:AraC family transcriptional regulator [Roseiconus nitratireducens]KAA5545492.1 AraC family transcriptional regulator [Roseiconus nitratireducens]